MSPELLVIMWGAAGVFVALGACSLFLGRARRLRTRRRGEPREASWYMEYLPSFVALYSVGNAITFQGFATHGFNEVFGAMSALTAASAIYSLVIAGVVIAKSNYRKHPDLSALSLLMILTMLVLHVFVLWSMLRWLAAGLG